VAVLQGTGLGGFSAPRSFAAGDGPVAVLAADFSGEFGRCGLPPELKKAVILYQGKLTPAYEYLSKFVY